MLGYESFTHWDTPEVTGVSGAWVRRMRAEYSA